MTNIDQWYYVLGMIDSGVCVFHRSRNPKNRLTSVSPPCRDVVDYIGHFFFLLTFSCSMILYKHPLLYILYLFGECCEYGSSLAIHTVIMLQLALKMLAQGRRTTSWVKIWWHCTTIAIPFLPSVYPAWRWSIEKQCKKIPVGVGTSPQMWFLVKPSKFLDALLL